ncbi:MAG: RICIN domain-containing protein, partial [Eggerthellaceae bacterium]|nr:RICIN domain-containing protein [Eggerthellaceae bacterium]
YYIQSVLNGKLMLDVANGSSSNGANAQIWSSNASAAQRWKITRNADGTYDMESAATGKVLDVAWGRSADGANVQLYSRNSTTAQRWRITRSGSAWVITSALSGARALDVSGANASPGANVQLYMNNGTTAQKWWLLPVIPAAPARTAADGIYVLYPSNASNLRLDLAGASPSNGTNIQAYTANDTIAQRWSIKRGSDGYYEIRSASSGTVIDVPGGDPAARANAQAWTGNGSDAQRWALTRNSDGTYTIASKLSGTVLEVANGSKNAGANVQLYAPNGTAAQRWTLKPVPVLPEGPCMIFPIASPTKIALDVQNASSESGATIQGYTANSTLAQRFYVRSVSGGTIRLQSMSSGLYLTEESGRVVQRPLNAASAAQRWNVSVNGSGVVFENAASGRRLALPSTSPGTATVAQDAANTIAQRWRVTTCDPLPNGLYELVNVNSDKALDIAGASLTAGANAQQYTRNNTDAQKFTLTCIGNGTYRVICERSRQALDVAGGSLSDNANVQQWTPNGTSAQLWRPILRENGGFELVNAKSGKALDVVYASKDNNANVQQFTRNGTTAQAWNPIPTERAGISGNAELDDYLRSVAERCGYNLRRCFDYMTNYGHVQSLDSGSYWGIVNDSTSIKYALYVKNRGVADCYGDASMFMWLARTCGYSANFRAGGCPSASGGTVPHGWTEVYINGVTYVCDPNLRRDLPSYNWYMITYGNAPVAYSL